MFKYNAVREQKEPEKKKGKQLMSEIGEIMMGIFNTHGE